ncbi:hypothetical protein KRP22_010986 [Phytophthora ramorum]|nr:Protein SUPPRESSOR OF QUENCHING 1, chloroplastic [Phytophthora ramorum]
MNHRGGFRCIGSGRRGHLDGGACQAELNRPFGVCTLRDGVLAFTDAHNNAVRFVIPERGRGATSKCRRKCHVKTLESSGLLTPKGIAASADERHLFVCDTGHHKIKLAALPSRSVLADVDKITDGVEMFAFAGNGKKGWRDGAALEASFNSPAGVCEYADGSIIVADAGNHCIRQIRRTSNGKLAVKTIAGAYASLEASTQRLHRAGSVVAASKRSSGCRDGVRSLFRSPSAIIAGPHGELLVADTMNNSIRGLLPPSDGTSPWKVSTICGQTRPGHADGNCEIALFDQPVSLCWGENSNTFFVADRGNACIRQVGRSCGAGLMYAWVRTIEIGDVPRSVRNQQQSSLPLGMVCIPRRNTDCEKAAGSKLVVCDGGNNVIKILPLEELMQHALNIEERFDTPQISSAHCCTFPQSKSDQRSCEDSEGSLSYVCFELTGFGLTRC